jgi:PAS domain S-box-containing protein
VPDPGEYRTEPRAAPNDSLTCQAVARYAVLDSPPDPAFDGLVDLALQLTGATAGGIAFLDRDRVWYKARRGLDVVESLREEYPASWGWPGPHAEQERQAVDGVITLDAPFRIGRSGYAFWAAAPVVTSEGYQIGQLFVVDDRPIDPGPQQLAALTVLARQVMVGLELRRTMMSYRAAVEGVGHVVFQLDDAHRLLSVTPTWVQLTGFGVVRSVGRPFDEFVHPQDRPVVLGQLWQMHDRDVASTFECRLRRLLDGDTPVEIIARPLIDESGLSRGLVGVIADISERKAREIEAQHAQKLEALGRLSTGLAHEINTPIQFVGDNTRFLADSCSSMLELIDTYQRVIQSACSSGRIGEFYAEVRQAEAEADLEFLRAEIPSAIRQSLDGVDRVATLVQAMKTFSKADPEAQAQTSADLNEALRAAVIVAATQVRQLARIDCDFAEIPAVICSIGDLNQVFLNMILNAADAIEEKGEFGAITVRTRSQDEHVVIEIADTGTGIPPEVRQRIFEPFFTTKEVGRGTGQGLALARAVVRDRHDGTITLATQVGVGTTFTIRLPVNGRAQTAPSAS